MLSADTLKLQKERAPDKDAPPTSQPTLLPKGRTGQTSRSVNDRMKHPRLNGADLYVARLGWGECSKKKQKKAEALVFSEDPEEDSSSETASIASSASSLPSSLHDELKNPHPKRNSATQPSGHAFDLSQVRASRPCYRCIACMHAAGIKRVFWTNDVGKWEGAKVRDLVDALEASGSAGEEQDATKEEAGAGAKGGPAGNGVFVTKHEVLMLRRLLGGGGGC